MVCVVVGVSAAGINAAKTLREIDKNIEIILVSKDEYVYSRCILHHFLDGRRDMKSLDFTPENFFETYKIKWVKGVEVIGIDTNEKKLKLSNNEEVSYDKVILATGSS